MKTEEETIQRGRPCPVCGQETSRLGLTRYDKRLEPCPFCGSKYVAMFTAPDEDGEGFIAGCTGCGARTREWWDYAGTIELWNRRAEHEPGETD